jgi:hypothetical protein
MRLRTLLVCCAVLALTIGVVTGGTATAKNGPPLISVEGGSYTVTTSITGSQVTGRLDFTIDGRKARDGSMVGSFGLQQYACLTNGSFDPTCSGPDTTLYQVAYENAKVACFAADAATRTVWFSGQVVAVDDQRIPAELLQQEQGILAQKKLIVIGRLQDTNGDGTADVRSLFMTVATTSYPNALTTDGDLGSPWFISAAGYSSAANACLQRDNAYLSADYDVVNGSTNTVQWLDPNDDITPIGSPITGTAANMANPPAAARYSLAPFNRTLLSPNLKLTIRN